MCTCINVYANHTYFGRNLDLDYSFNEQIIITPQNYKIKFKKEKEIDNHYAIIGIGTIINNYPLYADAINECGLAISGLNFPDNCVYYKFNKNKVNITPFELPLYLLSKYKNIKQVKKALKDINILDIPFSKEVGLTPLHFMISDRKESIVIETLNNKMHVFNNPYNVLTNNPPFSYHHHNLSNYMQLHNDKALNNINKNIDINNYSFGLGAYGLPGDFSSSSRFIKTFFVKSFLELNNDENNNINQFFKCLESVRMIKGVVKAKIGYEYTRYTSCYDLHSITLSYKTYEKDEIKKVSLKKYNFNNDTLISINL